MEMDEINEETQQLLKSDDGVGPLENLYSSLKHRVCGYCLALLSVCFEATSITATQLLQRSVPHSELNGLRFTAQFVINAMAALLVLKCDVRVPRQLVPFVICAGVVLTGLSYGQFGATYYLPLGVHAGFNNGLKLVLCYVASCVISRSVNIKPLELTAVIMCLLGIVLVTQPAVLFGNHPETTNNTSQGIILACNPEGMDRSLNNSSQQQTHETLEGYTLSAMCALFMTLLMLLVRYKLASINTFILNFWTSIIGIFISFFIMLLTENVTFPSGSICLAFLFLHLLTTVIGILMYSQVFKMVPTTEIAFIMTLMIPLTFTLQYAGVPGLMAGAGNGLEMTGAVVIFMGCVAFPLWEIIKQKFMNNH